jgi:hypothetical protein
MLEIVDGQITPVPPSEERLNLVAFEVIAGVVVDDLVVGRHGHIGKCSLEIAQQVHELRAPVGRLSLSFNESVDTCIKV